MMNTIRIDSLLSDLNLPNNISQPLIAKGIATVAGLVEFDRQTLQETVFKSRAPLEPKIGVLEAHLYEHRLVLGQPLNEQLQSSKEIAENTEFLSRTISSTFSDGIAAALKRKNIVHISDLKNKSYTDLLVIKGLGPVSVALIAQTLACNGIRLRSIYLAPEITKAEALKPNAKSVRDKQGALKQIPIEEPMLIGDTIQSTGVLFIATDADQAMAFKKFVLEKLKRSGLPDDFSEGDDLRFAVKFVDDYRGKPTVYVQQNLLNQLWDDQFSLAAAFKIHQDHAADCQKGKKR